MRHRALRMLWCCLTVCLCLVAAANAAQFVFLPLQGGDSPTMDLMAVAASLKARGHHVAVVVTHNGMAFAKRAAARHSSNTTAEALQYIEFSMPKDPFPQSSSASAQFAKHFRGLTCFEMLVTVTRLLATPCAALLQDTAALEEIKALQADAIMGVALPLPDSDSCGCVLSHLLGVPFIDINGHPMIDAPISVPQFGSGITKPELRTVAGFAKNVVAYIVRTLSPTLAMDYAWNPWPTLRRSTGLPQAASMCLLTNTLTRFRGQKVRRCQPLLEVILNSFLLEHARPLAAHQRLVGPGSPRPAHPILAPDVADFVSGAVDGLVLVALGSTLTTLTLTSADQAELTQGFAALAPVRVLWVVSEKGLDVGVSLDDMAVASNTKVVSWVDYNDVLGHPNTRAFASHCGVHSVNEATFHGVPVVAVPLHFEQAENAARLAARGVAVINYEAQAYRSDAKPVAHYTAATITSLIREVLANQSYARAASGFAAALQAYAAQRHPYDRAADEIELAVRTVRLQSVVNGLLTRPGLEQVGEMSEEL